MSRFYVFLIIMGLIGVNTGCVGEGSKRCVFKEDCGSGEICQSGKCVAGGGSGHCESDFDCMGGQCLDSACVFDGCLEVTEEGQLLINEVMLDPVLGELMRDGACSSESQVQFIEIVNPTDRRLSLKDLELFVGESTSAKFKFSQGCVPPKGGILLLDASTGSEISCADVSFIRSGKSLGLSKSLKSMRLELRSKALVVDEVEIADERKAGVSMVRNPDFTGAFSLVNHAKASYERYNSSPGRCIMGDMLSVGCKTPEPGANEDGCMIPEEGELVINELMLQSGKADINCDGEGGGEQFVELVNVSDKKLNMKGVVLQIGSAKYEFGDGCLESKQGALLYGSSREGFNCEVQPALLYYKEKLGFNPNATSAFLVDGQGNEISKIELSKQSIDVTGVSYQRIPDYNTEDNRLYPFTLVVGESKQHSAGMCIKGEVLNGNCSAAERDTRFCVGSDKNCGNECPDRCAEGKSCGSDQDCLSSLCVNNKCSLESCTGVLPNEGDLLVNEVMIRNTIADVNCDSVVDKEMEAKEVFIELVNTSDQEISLENVDILSLTPSSKRPMKRYSFNSKRCLKAKEGLVIYGGQGMSDKWECGSYDTQVNFYPTLYIPYNTNQLIIQQGSKKISQVEVAIVKDLDGVSYQRVPDYSKQVDTLYPFNEIEDVGNNNYSPGLCIFGERLDGRCKAGVLKPDQCTGSDEGCGGDCRQKCNDGMKCKVALDCLNKSCVGGVCKVAEVGTCEDKKQTDKETDVDCGGGVCKKCVEGKNCVVGSDCESDVCEGGKCGALPCQGKPAGKGDLLVNEVMLKNDGIADVNCDGKKSKDEQFMEIVNMSEKTISLDGLEIYVGERVTPNFKGLKGCLGAGDSLLIYIAPKDESVWKCKTDNNVMVHYAGSLSMGSKSNKIEIKRQSTLVSHVGVASKSSSNNGESYQRIPDFDASVEELLPFSRVKGFSSDKKFSPGKCIWGDVLKKGKCKKAEVEGEGCQGSDEGCGGTCEDKCDLGKKCKVASDCKSGKCTSGKCVKGEEGCKGVVPKPGELIINEIMAAPKNVDTNGDGVNDTSADEFVEIVNRSDETLSLKGVELGYYSSNGSYSVKFSFTGSHSNVCLAPKHSIVIMGKAAKEVPSECVMFGSKLGLANGGFSLDLKLGDTVLEKVELQKAVVDKSFQRKPDLGLKDEFKEHASYKGKHFSVCRCENGKKFSEGC